MPANSPTPHPLPDAARLADIRARVTATPLGQRSADAEWDRAELLAALDHATAQVAGLKQELADQEAEKFALTKDVLFFRASLATAETALVAQAPAGA